MKLNSLKYCLKEGFKNVFLNGIMSLASVSVMVCCMVLTGSAVLISMNLNQVLKSVENKNSITIYLKKEISGSKLTEIEEKINDVPNVLKCEYYSSSQASEKYEEVIRGFSDVLQKIKTNPSISNPFPEAFHVTMEDLSLYKETVEKLKNIEGVESISDRSETAKKLSDLSRLASTAGMWIVCSLGIISLFIIINTIRLTIHSRRPEISIMKSVGATNGFVCAPFLVEGVLIGLAAALISSVVLNLAYNSFIDIIGEIVSFHGVYFKNVFYIILGWFLLSGLFLGIVGSLISVRRYLKKEGVNFAS